MDQNLLTLLSGGGIAIISSFLTFLFQSRESNKKRKWELEDKESDKRLKIKLDRIDQIEKLEAENFFNAKEILSELTHYNNLEIFDAQRLNYSIASTQNKLQYLSAMARVLSDDTLDTLLLAFEGKFADFTRSVYSAMANRRENALLGEAGALYGELQMPFISIIIRLDEIRTNVSAISHQESAQ